jgi:hypothetical protein
LKERAHLLTDLVDQIVEARQVDRRLLEPSLRTASPVAIEPHARRLLEQLAPIVGAVGEQRVDHPALDDDARIGAEARAAHEILDVAQSARRAVQEVLAVARAREPPRDHDLVERHGERAVRVVEVQRYLGHVHRLARRGSLEDHLGHGAAAQHARALLA